MSGLRRRRADIRRMAAAFDELSEAPRERVYVAGPAGGDVVAVLHHERGAGVGVGVAEQAGGLAEALPGVGGHVEEVLGARQRARDLGLDAPVSGRLAR